MTLVLWSGGCDSTLALLNELRTASNCQTERVDTLSIIHPQVGAVNQQRMARRRISEAIRERSDIGGKLGQCYEITLQNGNILDHFAGHGSEAGIQLGNGGLAQPLIWLPLAQQYLGPEEDLVTGWIKGDCVWHFRTEINQIFETMSKVNIKTGELRFPLEWFEKSEVIQDLKTWDFLDMCWYCEGVGFDMGNEPCGQCEPCLTHMAAKYRLEQEEFNRVKSNLKWGTRYRREPNPPYDHEYGDHGIESVDVKMEVAETPVESIEDVNELVKLKKVEEKETS